VKLHSMVKRSYIAWGDDGGRYAVTAWGPESAAHEAARKNWEDDPWEGDRVLMIKDTQTGVVDEFTITVETEPVFTVRQKGA